MLFDEVVKNRKSTVIVVEDDDVLRDSYEYYFSTFEKYVLKGSYVTVEDALEEYDDIFPTIIVSDISIPGMGGINGIKKFKERDEFVKIIMVSIHDDMDHIMDSIKNLADGYLTKPINKVKLLNALDALTNNESPLSSDVSKKLLQLFQRSKFEMFSERENEILQHLMNGLTYKAIGEKLFITPSTVNFHLQNIYAKLDVKSKTEALEKIALLYKRK